MTLQRLVLTADFSVVDPYRMMRTDRGLREKLLVRLCMPGVRGSISTQPAVTFKPDGLEARVLYRTRTGPGPGTKARRREVAELTRTGLERALEALDASDVDVIGTSGFETREDTLSVAKKGGAA